MNYITLNAVVNEKNYLLPYANALEIFVATGKSSRHFPLTF